MTYRIDRTSEQRSYSAPVEMRADGNYFGGLGCVYYDGTPTTEAKIWDGMVERFYPTAFEDFLASSEDCNCFFDHDMRTLLARRSSKTLEITSNSNGLEYRAKYDPTDPDHQRVFAKIKRGDVRGSSIIFTVMPDGDSFTMENGIYVRHIRKAWLADIGPTPYPVYSATTAEPRSATPPQRELIFARARQELLQPPLDVEFWTR